MKKSPANILHLILQHIVWYAIKALIWTYRKETKNQHHLPKGPALFTIWHEHLVINMVIQAWTRPYLALASRSKDGDYAAFVAKKMGFIPVRGSSKKKNVDKGGKEAMEIYATKLREGHCGGGITVDGPKGPRHKCKPGVVLIAQQSGAAILPVLGVANRYWEFNSWDRFKLPKPFARITSIYGEPIYVPKDLTPEQVDQMCRRVEEALHKLEGA